MQDLQAFKALLASPKKIIIVTHLKPDADALGSSLGLKLYLDKKGHQVTVISPTDYPEFLSWMKGNEEVMIYNEGNEDQANVLINDSDIIFCLDFSSLHRINDLGLSVENTSCIKVLIDHHPQPDDFADFNFWDEHASATAELVYRLILDLSDQDYIDKDIAESLYAGIMTDTGNFHHRNTSPETHLITAELMKLGADVTKVSKLIYNNNSIDKLKFLGHALLNRLKVLPEYKTAFIAISMDDLEQFNSRTGDTEGLVNYALSVKDINLAALITENSEGVKLSFRSFGSFSVNNFARKHFNGGGHENAAGGKSDLSMEETIDKFVNLLEQYKHELKKDIWVESEF